MTEGETLTEPVLILRYSAKPIEAYSRKAAGVWLGPAYSVLRDDAEAWNLAWLSWPYEKQAEHNDPMFTTLVRRSVDTLRTAPVVDSVAGPDATVRGLLRLPPDEFFYEMKNLRHPLPLHRAYGGAWLNFVMSRALAPFTPAQQEAGLPLAQAAGVLKRISSART